MTKAFENAITLRVRVTFRQFGAVGDGIADDYAAMQEAINYVALRPGSKLSGASGDKHKISQGLVVPFDDKFQDPTSAVTIDFTGTQLIPAAGNMVCVKAARDFATIIKPMVVNSGGWPGVTACGLMPEDPAQTSKKVSQQFCTVINPIAYGCDVNVKMQPGPTVAGQASGAFYNTIDTPVARDTKCNVWLAGNQNALDVLNTRITIINPQHVGGNCSIFAEAADTTLVLGGSAENITTGVWPCATPTTINIPAKFPNHTLDNNSIRFLGFVGETGVIPYSIAAFYCPLDNCSFIGYTLPSVGDQSRTQWSNAGAVGSTSERAGKLALLFAKASNGKQAYISMDGAGATKAQIFSDTGFEFSSAVDIGDLRSTRVGGQQLGGDSMSLSIGGSGSNILFYNMMGGTSGFEFGGISYIRPDTDNLATNGTAAKRWGTIYAGTGTINTSDARLKQQVAPVDAAALRAMARINFVQFKFNDAVAAKGDKARWHYGVIAQQVKEAFEVEGLNPFDYGLLCYDEWTNQYEPVVAEREVEIPGPDGELRMITETYHTGEMKLVQAAGNRYGVRYDELHSLALAYLLSRPTPAP